MHSEIYRGLEMRFSLGHRNFEAKTSTSPLTLAITTTSTFEQHRRHGSSSSEVLPLLQEQAVPQVSLQPWCTRPEDSHLRSRPQACQRRRVPVLRPPGLQRV